MLYSRSYKSFACWLCRNAVFRMKMRISTEPKKRVFKRVYGFLLCMSGRLVDPIIPVMPNDQSIPGPVPFLRKPISKIPAPFPPNLWLLFPDFPPENLFSQAHFLWQFHILCQRDSLDQEQNRTKKENREPAGGTFHVPSNEAGNMT